MTRQGEILRVIERYIADHGCSPSSREIAAAAGLKSPSTALRYLKQLKADGYVTYQPGVPRTVRLLPRPAPDGIAQVLDARDPDQAGWVRFGGLRPPGGERAGAGRPRPGPGGGAALRRPAARRDGHRGRTAGRHAGRRPLDDRL